MQNSYMPQATWLRGLFTRNGFAAPPEKAARSDSPDALVLRILDEAAAKRPATGPFNTGQPTQPTASTANVPGSPDALIQRILDNAARQSTPVGLFDSRILGPVLGANGSSPDSGGGKAYEINGQQYPYDFLNHGVSADLRFRDILWGYGGPLPDHGFIVVHDPQSGSERAFQAGPSQRYPFPYGTIEAREETYGPMSSGYNVEPVIASAYLSPLPADALMQRLSDYGAVINAAGVRYVPAGPNSNTYINGAWYDLTGSVPVRRRP